MSDWFPIPSVTEERAHALKLETPWRYNGTLLRVVFSGLAALAVLASFGFFALLTLPKGWITAALAIGTSEWLIRRYRFFGTGVESALWLGGIFAFIFGLPSSGEVEAILVFAAAAALAGWRMRNAVFGLLATVLVIAYIAAKQNNAALTMSSAALIGIVAAFALRRVWQRPSTERLFVALALVMPAAGYIASVVRLFDKEFPASLPVAAVLGLTAVILVGTGIAWRDRALMGSGVISMALAAVELLDLFDYPAYAKLIAAGTLLVAIAAILSRRLRNATRGFVVTPVTSDFSDAIQIASIMALGPHGAPAAHQHSGPELAGSAGPTDKSFGGAGAGGGF